MPSLDDLYELYCGAASELNASPAGSARRAQWQEKADQLWMDYTGQGGGREIWHDTGIPWQYTDGFVEIHVHGSAGPIDQLRKLLKMPATSSPVFTLAEQDYVRRFQRNHNLPLTEWVDRPTWQAIVGVKGERKASVFPRSLELPGVSQGPVPIVIRTRKQWVLALDDVEERTYANHYNLALMAVLAYADVEPGGHVDTQMRTDWQKPRLLEDVFVWDKKPNDGGQPWRALVREDAKGVYEYGLLSNDRTHTQGFVLSHPRHCVIAFRGTEMSDLSVEGIKAAIADLSSDLKAAPQRWMYDGTVKDDGGAAGRLGLDVHKGFYEAFDSVREQLAAHLRSFRKDNPQKPIFVCGHSLGGGIAALAACYLRSHREFSHHPIQLYTFAQPRVGNRQFADHYWSNYAQWARHPTFRYFRTAHLFDWITMIPNLYLADNVADVADLLVDTSAAMASAGGPIQWTLRKAAAEAGKAWLRERLSEQAPPVDYRHFGVPVLCIHGADGHPFIVEALASSRELEDESIPRLQTVHEAKDAAKSARVERIWDHLQHVTKHMMGSYLTHGLHAFEHLADGYVQGREVFPPFASPGLAPLARELFHRFVHQAPHVALHTQEELRRAPD